MYESHHQRLLSRAEFVRRFGLHFASATALIVGSLFLGMAGYHIFESLSWVDAFLNAAMLLGGMGPVDPPHTEAGKLFAGGYALYAGLVFLVAVSIVLAPFIHRIMHRFHVSDEER